MIINKKKLFYYKKKKYNRCPEGIGLSKFFINFGLKNTFRNLLQEKKKKIDFFYSFFFNF